MQSKTSTQPLPSEEHVVLPFAGRSGKGVRVAVIDSGVNAKHAHIVGVAGGASVSIDGVVEEGSFADVLGHGTAVMAAIQEKAPEAEYFSVRLFHTSLRTTTDSLFKAIEWAIERRMDVINLSLGVRETRYAERFLELVAIGFEQGVMVVSALEMDGQRCLPGCLPGVVGVGLDWSCDRNRYRWEEGPHGKVFYTSGYPRSLPGVARERNLHGISFAVANMTGLIVRACEGLAHRSPQTISEALVAETDPVRALAAP